MFCPRVHPRPGGPAAVQRLGRHRGHHPPISDGTNDSYINADSVCELLRRLAELHLGVPITVVLDNARYQKCHLVQSLAEALQIELLYLPPYSPNLNLIERLWKFVKKKCLYSTYYANFNDFKQAISACLEQTQTTYKEELDTLLTLRFQTFKKSQIIKR